MLHVVVCNGTAFGPFPTEHHARDWAERNTMGQFEICPLFQTMGVYVDA